MSDRIPDAIAKLQGSLEQTPKVNLREYPSYRPLLQPIRESTGAGNCKNFYNFSSQAGDRAQFD